MALNVDDVFMGLRPRTAVGRAFATGRPRRRTIGARSSRRRAQVQNKVEAAYRRSDLFERRRRLMEEWEAYLAGERRDPEAQRVG